jgi:tripartite-type tricarboxylate transporter receptor subunit TctC
MSMKQHLFKYLLAVTASALAFGTSLAHADWPERPIVLVAPFAPGGNADLLARLIGNELSASLGRPVVVDNKPGAGGMIGSQLVARAKPDGYTFLLGSFANVLNEFFYTKKLIDLKKDLVPVTQVVSIPNFIAVNNASKYNSLKDLVDDAKARPEEVSCATSGIGTSPHLICEMLNQQLGIKISLIPYRGGIPAIADVVSGQATFVAANEALPYIKDKRLKGLAVTSPQKSPMAPELAIVGDTVPGFSMVSWYGIFAPVGTPKNIVDKMSAAVSTVVKSASMKERLDGIGATPVGSNPAEFTAFVAADLNRWEKIIKPLNIRLD